VPAVVEREATHTGVVYAWEQAKRSSDSPRAVGALLEPHIRADEDLRERESQLRAEAAQADESGDSALIYRAHHRLGLHLEAVGALEMAESAMGRAVEASDGAPKAHMAATNDHGVSLVRLGRADEARPAFDRATDIATSVDAESLAHSVMSNRGLLAWHEGQEREGLDLWSSAFGTARDADDATTNARILTNVAALRLLEEESEEAMQLLNRAILLAQRGGDIRSLAFTYNNLGLIYAGYTRGEHFAAIPFVEMALALLTGPVDVLARLYVLNNIILVHEQAYMEPARKFRAQFDGTLKFFSSSYPRRSADIERTVYASPSADTPDGGPGEDRWEIFPHPVLLRPGSRCGVQE
jgi:tetratricopeptide (TPR) repeat protein